jgi:hypothetical protein
MRAPGAWPAIEPDKECRASVMPDLRAREEPTRRKRMLSDPFRAS